jgi:cyanophycinase-like exopeptidase
MKPFRPRPGQVFVSRNKTTRTPSRRIVALLEDATVVYCSGGEQLRHCKVPAFRRWVARYGAVATRARRSRSIVLR